MAAGRAWNGAVHALLRHLDSVGFSGAPRSLVIEDDGRHKLSWVPGEAGNSAGDPDARLISSAQLIRRYHEAVRGFPPPAGLQVMAGAPLWFGVVGGAFALARVCSGT